MFLKMLSVIFLICIGTVGFFSAWKPGDEYDRLIGIIMLIGSIITMICIF